MLTISETVLQELQQTFLSQELEQGVLLGSVTCLEKVDHCARVLATQAGKHFYRPDTIIANRIIREWADKGICFSGFIHSHPVCKKDLSEDDMIYAKRLFTTYHLPLLWFGLGVVEQQRISFTFYCVSRHGNEVTIVPTSWKCDRNT